MLSKIRLRRVYRKTARLRFVVTSLITATGIFLISSGLPGSSAWGCVANSDIGFFCEAVNYVTTQPPFDDTDNAEGLRALFLTINLVIGGRMGWKGYQAWSAREAGEEFQSTINGIIVGLAVLFIVQELANRVVGVQ
ncbi:MAG: hypothetical protein QNJ32_30640 [Xenococcaceae cyanobacterium MO_167.B27]|nr:hypothetical protein [Xenococcaceae cyanobacterium MO_167.B27]